MQFIVPTFLIMAVALMAPHLSETAAKGFAWVCLVAAVVFFIVMQIIRRLS